MRTCILFEVLTDIERPSLHIIPHLYSRNTLTQLSDYHKHYLLPLLLTNNSGTIKSTILTISIN